MSTRIFNNLKLLQIIDGTLLACLLCMIALLGWFNLTDLTERTHKNLLETTTTLEQAQQHFLQHLQLKNIINNQQQIYDALNEEFLKFALNPDHIPDSLSSLPTLSKKLDSQYKQLTENWPYKDETALKAQYKAGMDTMIHLIAKAKDLPPANLRKLATEIQQAISSAKQTMGQIEKLDTMQNLHINEAVTHSIQDATRNTTQIEQLLTGIKQQTLWGMLAIMVFLLASRLYFSSRFCKFIRQAQAAQQVAEDAVKTKARFLATMSHEIRTPMNGVIGMTRLLMNTPMSKKQTEFVDSIHLSGEHLLTVINDVLDFSKIEAGKLDIKREPFELRACIEEILNLLHSKALEKNLELAYAVDPSVPLFIEGDMVRVRQVLTNLAGNAIKFTDSGEITIFVTPHAQVGEELELEFQINDTGPGIPADRLETIFEQFSRADESLTNRHEGTGLGLTISRHLVEMMGGNIWVESTLGVGSRFYFTISTRKAEGKLKPFLHNNIPEIVGKRILVVENNPASSQAIQDFCQGWGASVDLASTSACAISRIAVGKPYDIALIESNLPGDTPMELAKYIRQRFSKQELPLILIAPPNDRHPKEIVRALFNLYLTKPLTRSRLFDSLMTALGELNLVTTRPEKSRLKLGERLPLTILLAEDNPINQIVASSILDEMAYKTELAENGLQVLEAMQNKAYDVIFMDMQMPEMDGLEATRRIRAEFPPGQQPVIIAMTANAMESDKQECLKAGMNDYISKPVLPEAVEAALARWSKTKPEHQPPEETSHATADN